jgi:hypothetical protein
VRKSILSLDEGEIVCQVIADALKTDSLPMKILFVAKA